MRFFRLFYMAVMLAVITMVSSGAYAASAQSLNQDADQALQNLITTRPFAGEIYKNSKAVLIFPNIVKAGLVFGGAYGEGVMKQNGKVQGYYNSVTASWGLQAGAQSYGYVVFLMSDKAIEYLNSTKGWEIGVGPTVVMVDEGVSKNLSTSTLKDDAYAYIFGQQGLMAGISIEGSKITRIKK